MTSPDAVEWQTFCITSAQADGITLRVTETTSMIKVRGYFSRIFLNILLDSIC
jgi:hypothetical protein